MKNLLILLAFSFLAQCDLFVNQPPVNNLPNTFTDPRDGAVYKTVQLNGKTWMSENLKFSTPNSWCYERQTANCNVLGRLYSWEDALVACPKGWHLPSSEEWKSLLNYFGGYYWPIEDFNSGNSRISYEKAVEQFNMVLSGLRFPDNTYQNMGSSGYYWSSDENSDTQGGNVAFSAAHNGRGGEAIFNNTLVDEKDGGFSCRCVKD